MSLPRSQPEVAAEPNGYEADFAAWSFTQAELIRSGRLGEADIENIAEEIESLGREQFSKLASAFEVVLIHMLEMGSATGTAIAKLECVDQHAPHPCP